MSGVTGYLWRVICAAVVCALVGAVAGNGPGSRLRQVTAWLFLTLTALSALGDVRVPELDTDRLRADAEAAVSRGIEQARLEKNSIITESMEAYIWNKAAELGLQVQVRVSVDEEGLPLAVELTGCASPSEREKLMGCITRELGLGREAQIWIDPYQSSE